MENRRTKLLPKIIAGQTAVALLVAVIALSILFYAEGYRINLKSRKILKTGIVHLVSFPKKSDVYINGKLESKKTPFAKNLLPGNYSIDIKMDGYSTWSSNIKIESQFVKEFKNIILIKENIVAEPLADDKKINLLYIPSDVLANTNGGLYFNEFEIWYNSSLVARFSEPVEKAIWYPDHEHIIYQQGDSIRIIDKNGRNDTKLVKLSSKVATKFTLNAKGDELYFIDNDQYFSAKIR